LRPDDEATFFQDMADQIQDVLREQMPV